MIDRKHTNIPLSEILALEFSNAQKPAPKNIIYDEIKNIHSLEQSDLIEYLEKFEDIGHVDQFYIDIFPTYLSPTAMKYFLPKFLAKFLTGEFGANWMAIHSMMECYDVQECDESFKKRMHQFKALLNPRQMNALSATFAFFSIDRHNFEEDQVKFTNISRFFLVDE